MAATNDIKSLYFHIPFCRHLCNYCDFYKVKFDKTSNDLVQFQNYLENAWLQHESFLAENQFKMEGLDTLYFGGGTPSLWGKSGADFFKDYKREKFSLNQGYEFTMEADPAAWDEFSMTEWINTGVNRFSLGVQSFSEKFLKVLDRNHTKGDVIETLEYFSDSLDNYSVDFLIGIPNSVEYKRDVLLELEQILKFEPKHISLYILSTRKNYPLNQYLPTEDFVADEYLSIANFLKDKGFNHYEVSNFAKPGYESKHNLAYWNYHSVAGIGPSATGLITNDQLTKRYKWKVSSAEFQIENLSISEVLLEKIYLALRTNLGLDLKQILDMSSYEKILKLSKTWEDRGLATIEDDKVILNSNGFLILDTLMNEIFNKIDL